MRKLAIVSLLITRSFFVLLCAELVSKGQGTLTYYSNTLIWVVIRVYLDIHLAVWTYHSTYVLRLDTSSALALRVLHLWVNIAKELICLSLRRDTCTLSLLWIVRLLPPLVSKRRQNWLINMRHFWSIVINVGISWIANFRCVILTDIETWDRAYHGRF
jgi:hypothetical protein